MRRSYQIALVTLLAVASASYLSIGWGTNAGAQLPQMHLDLRVRDNSVPPICTTWHELYPAYCTPHHQTGYEDNGDGVVSVCDYIHLDGVRYHIVWVGPTYFMSCGTDQGAWEPTIDQTGENPTCETWHQVWPDYCASTHVDGWIDNGDGVLGVCDVILINTGYWHIDEIGLDIIVEPSPTSTLKSSWGTIKKLFGKTF